MKRITDSQVIKHTDGGSHEQLYCFGHLWGPAYFKEGSKDYKEYLSIVQKLKAYEDTGLTPEEIMGGKMLTGWIPVEEQLPEPGTEVLTYIKHNYAEDGWRAYRVYEFTDHWVGMGNLCEVIAWMPLPEPYAPQTEELPKKRN